MSTLKPGDLVITVLTEEEQNDPNQAALAEYFNNIGRHGIIVRSVTFEDGDFINRWCDWWVLIDGQLQTWTKENMELIE